MVKRVLATYDFSNEALSKFISANSADTKVVKSMMRYHGLCRMLYSNMEKNGIEVEMMRYVKGDDPKKIVEELKSKVDAADLIFHDASMIDYDSPAGGWGGRLREDIDLMLLERALDRTNFYGILLDYTDKNSGAKIAKDAGIPTPTTWKVEDYLKGARPLPVILKNRSSHMAEGVFFIERHSQLDRFFNEELYRDGRMPPRKSDHIIQRYINSPSNHYTHFRIFSTGDGRILASALCFSGSMKDIIEVVGESGPLMWNSRPYDNIESPLFMGRRRFGSNVAVGGRQIPIDGNINSKTINSEDAKILEEHGLDGTCPTMDPKLLELSTKAAKAFSKFGVIYGGQDWVQDRKGNFYFLEMNLGPGMEIFNTLYNGGAGTEEEGIAIGTEKLALAIKDYKITGSS